MAHVKPASHCVVADADFDELVSLFKKLGLRSTVFRRNKLPSGAERIEVVYGTDPREIERTIETWEDPKENPGLPLGYPPCCVEFYLKWTRDLSHYKEEGQPKPDDIVWRSADNTSSVGPFSFLLNNSFYNYSRLFSPDTASFLKRLAEKNRGIPMDLLNVIPWHPCSFDCRESLEKGFKIFGFLSESAPKLSAMIKVCLSKPILFWNWKEFAVLDGALGPETTVSYAGLRPPFSLADEEQLAPFKGAGKLRPEGNDFEVFPEKGSRLRIDGRGARLLLFQ